MYVPLRFAHIANQSVNVSFLPIVLISQQNKITALLFISNTTAAESVDLGCNTAHISIIISESFLHLFR